MAKLTYRDKINLYKEWKKGKSIAVLIKEYGINRSSVIYLTKLIDKHGYKIIKNIKNKKYTIQEKERIINRVLIDGESILNVSIDEGIVGKGLLNTWIKNYKEMGYNIVERKRGRSTMPKVTKKKNKETIEEENKRLKEENEYLKAELEYSKKLRAVVQARKNQQQKKK